MNIPEDILSTLRSIAESETVNKFQGAEITDDGILAVSSGDRIRRRKSDFIAYLYYGPYDSNDKGAVLASNYGFGLNIRGRADDFREFLSDKKKAVVAELESRGFVIRGWEEDFSCRQSFVH